MTSAAEFFGSFLREELARVAQIERSGVGSNTIASLVVAAALQHRGIGRSLLQHLVNLYGADELRVQTAVLNVPALTLHRQSDFV